MVVVAAAVAFAAGWVGVRLVERYASALGLIDVPNDRSSHVVPRPRGGGLGVLAGLGAGLLVAVAFGAVVDTKIGVVLLAALSVAAIGIWDDVSSLPVRPKLAVHVIAAAVVVLTCGGFSHVPLPAPLDASLGWLGVPLAIIWIVGVTNFFNFMDGADGLAGGQAFLTFGAIAWVVWPAPIGLVALLAASAIAAFLTRNWAPARIFLGDVGSGWAGFVLAALPFALPAPAREPLAIMIATSLALFLVDPIVTLRLRMARGRSIVIAHREHAYQRLIDPRHSHARAVGGLLAAAAAITVVAALAYRQPSLAWWSVAWAALVSVLEWVAVARVEAARRRSAAG